MSTRYYTHNKKKKEEEEEEKKLIDINAIPVLVNYACNCVFFNEYLVIQSYK